MTQEDIIRMAREAGDDWDSTLSTDKKFLKRFADIVAEGAAFAEREACAKVCDARYMGDNNREDTESRRCAEAIRARGQA